MDAPSEGTVIDGRYKLGREIARGGMSIVYQAEHLYTGRPVALKILQPQLTRDPDCRARLLREAKALALSRHANVVEILDAGVTMDNVLYLVMEMLDGRALDGLLTARGTLSTSEAVYIGAKLCEGLAHAHAHGVMHRDIKPSNIFVVRDDGGRESLKLIDFGIVAMKGEPEVEQHDRKLTQRGAILGTPEYMAPEQLLMKDEVDHRADVYGIAVTIFECLTGAVPFQGKYAEVLLGVSTKEPPSIRSIRPDVGEQLAHVVQKALSREPSNRYTDCVAFGRALTRAIDTVPKYTQMLDGSTAIDLFESDVEILEAEPRNSHRPPPLPHRRRHVRAPYVTPVRIVRADGEVVEGRSEDISEGGLLVLTPQNCGEAGGRATVYFAPPAMSRSIAVQVTARWIRDGRGGVAAGLEFVNVNDDLRLAVASYVKVLQGVLAQ